MAVDIYQGSKRRGKHHIQTSELLATKNVILSARVRFVLQTSEYHRISRV